MALAPFQPRRHFHEIACYARFDRRAVKLTEHGPFQYQRINIALVDSCSQESPMSARIAAKGTIWD